MLVMVTESELSEMVKKAKEEDKERKFKQALELIMVFKDIDVKKGFALNEIVQLPKTSSPASVCVLASGDMGIKAKNGKADKVVGTDELNQLGANKRESRKFINKYDFFLADTQLMPVVGKVLGQLLGPRGKMPTPVPFNAPIESLHTVVIEKIGKIEGIQNTETFVELQMTDKDPVYLIKK